jgi:hypothetical protein
MTVSADLLTVVAALAAALVAWFGVPKGMTYADTAQFLRYYPADINGDGTQTRTPRADASTGTVDMARYLQWLRDNGYELGNLQVQ